MSEVDFRQWEDDVLFPALYNHIGEAFPTMEFKQVGSRWESRYHTNGVRDSKGQVSTYVYSNNLGVAIGYGGKVDKGISRNKNLIVLYSELNGVDWITARNALASICGVVVPKQNSEKWIAYQQKLEGLEKADEIFRTALQKETAEAKKVREYLHGRQWTDEEIRLAGLGLITKEMIPSLPDSKLYNLRVDKAVVGETHLLTIPYRSGYSLLGFKFREVVPKSETTGTKYLNTAGLKKSSGLLGIKRGMPDIVVVEGELDALHAQVRGAQSVVATAGGKTSVGQIQDAIRKGVNKFTLLFDSDDRGQEFIHETVKTIEETRGAVKASVYVTSLPEGFKDTDEYLASHSIDEFNAIVASAQPYSLYRANNIIEGYLAKQKESVTDKEQADMCRNLIDALNAPYVLPTERASIYNALASQEEELGFKVDDLREQAKKAYQYEEEERTKERKEKALREAQKLISEGEDEQASEVINQAFKEKGTKERAREYEEVFTPKKYFNYDKYLGEVRSGIPTGYIFESREGKERLTLNSGLTFICGYRGHGKTSFLNNIALNDARRNLELGNGKSVLYFSYEVDKRRLTIDLLNTFVNDSEISDNPARTMLSYFKAEKEEEKRKYFKRGGNINDRTHYENFKEKKKEFFNDYLASGALVVVEENYKVETLLDAIKYYISNRDVSIVCIDYAQLLYSEDYSRQRTEEIKKIVNDIRDFANKQGIPFVLAAQFNRNVTSPATVSTNNIGEGGDFERIADTCIGLFNLKELRQTPSEAENKEAKAIVNSLIVNGSVLRETPFGDREALVPIQGKLFVRLMKRRTGQFPIDTALDWEGRTKKIKQNDTKALAVKGWNYEDDPNEEEQPEEPITF